MLAAIRYSSRATAQVAYTQAVCRSVQRAYSVKADTKLLSRLRKETELSMTQCKEALVACNNDYDAAMAWLDEKLQVIGMKKASKLEGRVMTEGLVSIFSQGNTASMAEVNCETDFVGKNDNFQDLARKCAEVALGLGDAGQAIADIDPEFLKNATAGGQTLNDMLIAAVGKLGENMAIRRAVRLTVPVGTIGTYLHAANAQNDLGKMGALVAMETPVESDKLKTLSRQLATHVVGMRPENLDDFLSQQFVFDGAKTVAQVVNEAASEAQGPIKITGFVRYECGEGIEKRQENFAEEVAKQMRG